MNLPSKISDNLFKSFGKSALKDYFSKQIVKYPYNFLTGALKYGVLYHDKEKMWEAGLYKANMSALFDFGDMAYTSYINFQYGLYMAGNNYQNSLDLNIQNKQVPNNYYLPTDYYDD